MDNTKLLRMIGTTLGTLAGKIDTALAESRPPCGVPCATGHCDDNTAGVCTGPETCAKGLIMPLAVLPAPDVPVEELLQDYTLAQWDEIREAGYLCEFTDEGEYPANGRVQRLLGVRNDIRAPFQTNNGWRFLHCRPAQIPGVLRPWFGGDCPVADGTMVLVEFKDEEPGVFRYPDTLSWARHGCTDEIIAYMEV